VATTSSWASAAGGRVDGNCLALVENGGDLVEVGIARANERSPRMNSVGKLVVRGGVGDIHRHDEDGDAPSRQRCLTGRDGLAADLLRRKDHLAEDTAASVHVDEVDLLDRFEAQVLAHDLACDQDDRGRVAIGLVEPVDEVETAGAARACAGGEAAGELSFGPGRERSGLLVPHMDPLDCAAVDGVSDLVQRVAHDPVAPLYTGTFRGRHFRVRFVRFQGLAAPCQALLFLSQFQRVRSQTVSFAAPCRNAVATFVLRASPPRF
jgi:hypothetical protein